MSDLLITQASFWGLDWSAYWLIVLAGRGPYRLAAASVWWALFSKLLLKRIGLFFAGRVVAGAASGIMLTTVNVYQAEIAPPHLRGTMVAFQIVTLNVAGALASWVGYACNFAQNRSFAWSVLLLSNRRLEMLGGPLTFGRRFPIALQCLK